MAVLVYELCLIESSVAFIMRTRTVNQACTRSIKLCITVRCYNNYTTINKAVTSFLKVSRSIKKKFTHVLNTTDPPVNTKVQWNRLI